MLDSKLSKVTAIIRIHVVDRLIDRKELNITDYRYGRKISLNIYATRCVKNVDDYERFVSAIADIAEASEIIALKMHLEKYRD